MDGFTNDELLQIGTRKAKMPIAMSATDINSPMPFEVAQEFKKHFSGNSEEELKDFAQGRIKLDNIPPEPKLGFDAKMASVLDGLGQLLGIRNR